ncbi:MAG: sensor histidine kinase [Bdellovibrio bacteriovorus]
MTRPSLRARLLLAASVSITLALVAAGLGLSALFERHVTRYEEARLDRILDQILGDLELGPDGHIRLSGAPADPRFDTPLSGLYWQIQDDRLPTLLRSRSLWDQMLKLPGDDLPDGVLHHHDLDGPAGQALLVLERRVLFRPESEARQLRVAVALDRRELVAARRNFATDMLPYLVILGLALVLAAWLQVRVGLAPLERLRHGVRAIRSEGLGRLEPDHPEEVLPLVEELNALIAAQEGAVERARAWTADLAHGLKTPLVALAADAERLRALDQPELAKDLEELAQMMRRRVDRELIRGRMRARQPGSPSSGPSRVAGGPPPVADLGACLDGLIRTLARTPPGARIDWDLECPAGVRVGLAPEDLAELLGNVLENAVQWARGRVAVGATTATPGGWVEVGIEDDGPGVPESALPLLGQRGLRLDQSTQGSGLGLAIVQDICEAYGAQVEFAPAGLGGLRVQLRLPGTAPAG